MKKCDPSWLRVATRHGSMCQQARQSHAIEIMGCRRSASELTIEDSKQKHSIRLKWKLGFGLSSNRKVQKYVKEKGNKDI